MSVNKLQIMLKLQKQAKQAVAASATMLQKRIVDKLSLHQSNIGAGGIASPAGSPPGQNTGELARHIQMVDVTTSPMKPTYRVGTNIVYAKIQEFGGRIRAVKSKFLTIPIGVDGKRAAKKANGDIRSLKLFPVRIHGKLFLVEWKGSTKKGGASKPKILFALRKEVYLPARPYFRPAIAEHKKDLAQRLKGLGVKL